MSFVSRTGLALGLLLAATAPGGAATLEVGAVAPDFTLLGSDGGETTLSQVIGEKNVVLAFFPKAFTGG